MIEDCSLSFFSKYKNKNLGSFGDAAIFSFELSKTISIQKGGCLIINNKNLNLKLFKNRYDNIKYPSYISNIRKKLQILSSIYMYNSKFYNIWFYLLKILYNTPLFEKSTPTIENYLKINEKRFLLRMNDFYKKILYLQTFYEKKITQDSIKNFEYLKSKLCTKNLYMALDKIDNTNYLIRLPLILRDKKLLQKIISEVNFEIGYWFKNLATDNRFSKFQFIKKKI